MKRLFRRPADPIDRYDAILAAEERVKELKDMKVMAGDLANGVDRLYRLEAENLEKLKAKLDAEPPSPPE